MSTEKVLVLEQQLVLMKSFMLKIILKVKMLKV